MTFMMHDKHIDAPFWRLVCRSCGWVAPKCNVAVSSCPDCQPQRKGGVLPSPMRRAPLTVVYGDSELQVEREIFQLIGENALHGEEDDDMEVGLLFDYHGRTICWHLPPGRTAAYLPDSGALWDKIWEHRNELGGFAHTHPWSGRAGPSTIDLTTFAAIEAALAQRLVWPIVTMTEVGYFVWVGPDKLDYAPLTARRFRLSKADIERLRELSRGGTEP